MNRIINKGNIISCAISDQEFSYDFKYRPFFYVRKVKIDDGYLLYNSVTGEIFQITDMESKIFDSKEFINDDFAKELVKNWFLVPEDFDDYKFFSQINNLINSMNKINTKFPIVNYIILPTTDCNARCFYCFELGGSRKSMNSQTAKDVVDYIVNNCNGEEVSIRWFGGEPLYNSEAIDIICQGLKNNNIKYTSSMISNGYLFSEDTVKKAIELWNLNWVQITLDGTEDIYNKIKAYIYKEGNPFKIVIENIESLLKVNIRVHIRMNMDEYNSEDLKILTKNLIEKFGKYENLYIYSNLLFEDTCDRIAKREAVDRHSLIMKQIELQSYISKHGIQKKLRLKSADAISHCMADCGRTIMILPDGKLGKCEHYTEDHFIGSIYSQEIDYNMLDWFKTTRTVEKKCNKCELLPSCIYPVCCMSKPNRCDEFDKQLRIQDIDSRIMTMYREYLNNKA